MLILGQATVPSNSTVVAFRIPPGTANTIVYQPSNPQAVYIGPSPNVAATTGMPVPVTPVSEEQYVTSGGMAVYATTGNATASSFCYILSTGQ